MEVFRNVYKLAGNQVVRWFPGHMQKGLKQMQQKLRSVDCVIEVHDARIPFSGRNPELYQSLTGDGAKPHILVLNKKDMIDSCDQFSIKKALRREEGLQNILFTNCKDQQCPGIRRLVPLANQLINEHGRYNRSTEKDFSIMIVGVPNVGKSSLINVLRNTNLRKKAAAKVGNEAGVTRSVMEKIKISDNPLMYMIDTPGILEPRINDDEMGMKLALVGCVPDKIVGDEQLADYLLYWLNKQRRFEYVPQMGLENPCDNVIEVLVTYACLKDLMIKARQADGRIVCRPDILRAAKHFVKLFRQGELGAFNLDNTC